MQSKQARSDPLRCIARPNSSSTLILLRLFLHLHRLVFFRHRFKTIDGTEMADVEQTQKMIPFITCEISLCQYVCELVLGVNEFNLDLGVQIDSIKQPIKRNSVSPGNMSHCGTSSFYDHLDHCFVVFKDIQHSFLM